MGMGVSYCATCDGAFFKKKTAAVVGGGDVAIEDAIFLARICEKVYLIHRRNELRGAKSLQKKLMEMENVEILWDTVTDSINGENKVESLSLTNKKREKRGSFPWTAYSLPWGSLPIQRPGGPGGHGRRPLYPGGRGWKNIPARDLCGRRRAHEEPAPDRYSRG